MLNWSLAGILEKNKLANDAPFLLLVQLDVPGLAEPIRLVRNNEDISWNGHSWIRFPIDLDKVTAEDGKELPAASLKVSNVGGMVQTYVQQYKGFCDAPVKLMIVHAKHLDNPVPELEMDYIITKTDYDEQWVIFNIGASNDHSFRFPFWRYLRDFCPHYFKDIMCGYAGNEEPCDNTLATCRIRDRYNGEKGLQSS